MEGADSFITYLPEEKEDAEKTKSEVEKHGRKCHIFEADLRDKKVCRQVVEEAWKVMGGVNVLFNNHAYQMITASILELEEEQWERTFETNIHREFLLRPSLVP